MNENIFESLRNMLTNLYSDENSIRRIIFDAGITLANIALNSSPINNWHAVLTEAIKAKRVDILLAKVKSEYGANDTVLNTCEAYEQDEFDNKVRQLSQKAQENVPDAERLNLKEFDSRALENKRGETRSNFNNPLAETANEVKVWFFKELQPKEQSLLLTTALLEDMDRQKLVQVMTELEQILSTDN